MFTSYTIINTAIFEFISLHVAPSDVDSEPGSKGLRCSLPQEHIILPCKKIRIFPR